MTIDELLYWPDMIAQLPSHPQETTMSPNRINVPVIPYPEEKICSVSPEMASTWVENFNYHHQRPIRSWHVAALSRMMEDGRFRQKTQINFCRFKGQFYLTNGQHTLRAIVRSGLAQVLSVIVTDVDSMDAIADDFSRHDTHLTRRHSDSLVAHEVHDRLGITRTELHWVSGACIYYAWGVGETGSKSSTSITHDEKMDIVLRHGELAVAALNMIPSSRAKGQSWATRKTTLAGIMFTLHRRPDIAEQFWPLAVTDDGLSLGDPRKTLNRYLESVVVTGGSHAVASQKKRAGDIDVMKHIAVFWNAYLKRRDLKVLRVNHEARIAEFEQCGTFRG